MNSSDSILPYDILIEITNNLSYDDTINFLLQDLQLSKSIESEYFWQKKSFAKFRQSLPVIQGVHPAIIYKNLELVNYCLQNNSVNDCLMKFINTNSTIPVQILLTISDIPENVLSMAFSTLMSKRYTLNFPARERGNTKDSSGRFIIKPFQKTTLNPDVLPLINILSKIVRSYSWSDFANIMRNNDITLVKILMTNFKAKVLVLNLIDVAITHDKLEILDMILNYHQNLFTSQDLSNIILRYTTKPKVQEILWKYIKD